MAVSLSRLNSDTELKPGKRVRVQAEDGQPLVASIVEVGETMVTLDANHPLAGRELVFELRLLQLVKQIRYGLREPSG